MGDNIIRDVQFIDWLGEQRPFYGHKIMSIPSTPTPTPTATNTPTPSVTPTFTPTKSVTPSKTPTNTPTLTKTPTTTPTPTQTPTYTPSSTNAPISSNLVLSGTSAFSQYLGTYTQFNPTGYWQQVPVSPPEIVQCGGDYSIWNKTLPSVQFEYLIIAVPGQDFRVSRWADLVGLEPACGALCDDVDITTKIFIPRILWNGIYYPQAGTYTDGPSNILTLTYT